MAGIHVHQHDLVDEGAAAIASWLARFDDLTHLFVQINDIFERNPSPSGTLERNPIRPVIVGAGRWYADVDPAQLSPALHQQRDDTGDPLSLIEDSTLARDHVIVPWVNLLNGAWSGNVESNCVVDLHGRQVSRWLCPNAPDVLPMWQAVLGALVERYSHRHYLLDRIRFPDWGGERVSPSNLLTCFCEHCEQKMGDAGIEVAALRAALTRIEVFVGRGDFSTAVGILTDDPLVREWIAFRQNSITQLVGALTRHVLHLDPDVELWLDLWPPAYAWVLGQDYSTLTAISSRLKHFPYHRLGGGADVLSLIDSLAHDEAEHEAAFAAFTRLFGVDYGITLAQFRAAGFPLCLVQDQNRRVRESSAPDTFIWSGVQLWNVPAAEAFSAAQAAYASADDVIYYCYGWATYDLFGATNGARAAGRVAASAHWTPASPEAAHV